MAIKNSNYKVEDFYKTLSNGKRVFDFHKVFATGYPTALIMSPRGSTGKSFNAKEYARDIFQKSGKKTMWMLNTVTRVQKEVTVFLDDMKKDFPRKENGKEFVKFWDNLATSGNVKEDTFFFSAKDKPKKPKKLKKDGKPVPVADTYTSFIKAQALSQGEYSKGSRPDFGLLVYDEINVAYNKVRNPLVNYTAILGSLEDPVANFKKKNDLKILMFGNMKSLNHELIYKLGIRSLEQEITEVLDDNGNKLMLIIVPKYTEAERAEIKADNNANFLYQLNMKLGSGEHMYFNDNLMDDINGVTPYMSEDPEYDFSDKLQLNFSVYHKKKYFNVYKVIKGDKVGNYHVHRVPRSEIALKGLVTLNTKDKQLKAPYKRLFKKAMIRYLAADRISFEDVSSRELFMTSIS